MSETARVGPDNQITLPDGASQAVGVQPGDTVRVRATGPKTLEVTVLPRMTLAEWLEQHQSDEPLDIDKLMAEAEEAQADEYVRKFYEGKE